jgi:hypothetical protein
MGAAEYRRQANYYLKCAGHMSNPNARASMLDIAAYWIGRAERAEQDERLVQQLQVMTPQISVA